MDLIRGMTQKKETSGFNGRPSYNCLVVDLQGFWVMFKFLLGFALGRSAQTASLLGKFCPVLRSERFGAYQPTYQKSSARYFISNIPLELFETFFDSHRKHKVHRRNRTGNLKPFNNSTKTASTISGFTSFGGPMVRRCTVPMRRGALPVLALALLALLVPTARQGSFAAMPEVTEEARGIFCGNTPYVYQL